MASTVFQNPYSDNITSSGPPRFHANTFQNTYSHHNTTTVQDQGDWRSVPGAGFGLSTSTDMASPDRRAVKLFAFRRKALRTDMQIVNIDELAGETPAYFAAVTSAWKANRPDVTLHAGADATGRILGAAHFRWTGQVTLGLGDPINDPMGVIWEDLRRPSLWKNKFTFEFTDSDDFNVNIPSSLDGPRRRHFMWQRTADAADGVEGIAAKFSLRNYRLVDQDTGDVIAVFLADNLKSLKKKGDLRIFRTLSPDVEKMVILSCASISEKMTRD